MVNIINKTSYYAVVVGLCCKCELSSESKYLKNSAAVLNIKEIDLKLFLKKHLFCINSKIYQFSML